MSTYTGDDDTPRAAEGSSKDGGEYLSTSGSTRELKWQIYRALGAHGTTGMTSKEFSGKTAIKEMFPGVHHGQVSSAFSTMHAHGLIARLTERRGHYEVYVLLENVGERETREHSSVVKARKRARLSEAIDAVEAIYPHGITDKRMIDAVHDLVTEANHYIGRDQ